MSNTNKKGILFGAGTLYVLPPERDIDLDPDEEIENALIKIGESSGEATLNFTENFHSVFGGELNQEIANFKMNEECTFNAGVCTFDMEKINEITSSYYSEDGDKRTLGLGGKMTAPLRHLRYVHTKREDGKKIYLDMFQAQNQSGLEMTFNPESESVFNWEFKLLADQSRQNGNIVRITEEI